MALVPTAKQCEPPHPPQPLSSHTKVKLLLFFVLFPVRICVYLRPVFMHTVVLSVEVMAVGGLLYCQIVPILRPIIRPDIHIRQQVILILGEALKDPIDQGHGLGTRDLMIGAERSGGITTNPAQGGGPLNFHSRPMTGDVCKVAARLDARIIEPGADGRNLLHRIFGAKKYTLVCQTLIFFAKLNVLKFTLTGLLTHVGIF